jgi:hypothetical protein
MSIVRFYCSSKWNFKLESGASFSVKLVATWNKCLPHYVLA